MAFTSKLGSLLRLNRQVPGTSMLNSIRSMSTSTSKLYVGGLPYSIDDVALREAFSCFGEVTGAKIIIDRETGRSRGFGFVNFADGESASNAMSYMDGQELNCRNIRVNFANERPPGPRSYGGGDDGGVFRGGYGGDVGGGGFLVDMVVAVVDMVGILRTRLWHRNICISLFL